MHSFAISALLEWGLCLTSVDDTIATWRIDCQGAGEGRVIGIGSFRTTRPGFCCRDARGSTRCHHLMVLALSAPARVVIALMAVAVLSCQIPTLGGNPPTTVAIVPDLGPAPDQIPADPLEIVTMQPGPRVLNDVHGDFVVNQAGYVAGSGRVDAVYQGREGNLFILTWRTNDPQMGPMICRGTAPPDALPSGFGCGSAGEAGPFTIEGYSHTSEPGPQSVMVEHSTDAEATVLELADGSTFVIRPNGSPVSYHTWNGPRPARFTVFWDNGTTTSEVLTP